MEDNTQSELPQSLTEHFDYKTWQLWRKAFMAAKKLSGKDARPEVFSIAYQKYLTDTKSNGKPRPLPFDPMYFFTPNKPKHASPTLQIIRALYLTLQDLATENGTMPPNGRAFNYVLLFEEADVTAYELELEQKIIDLKKTIKDQESTINELLRRLPRD